MRLTQTDKFKLRHIRFLKNKDIKALKNNFYKLEANDQKLVKEIVQRSYEKSLNKFKKLSESKSLTKATKDPYDTVDIETSPYFLFSALTVGGLGTVLIGLGILKEIPLLGFFLSWAGIIAVCVGSKGMIKTEDCNHSTYLPIPIHPILKYNYNKAENKLDKIGDIKRFLEKCINDDEKVKIEKQKEEQREL